VRDRKTCQSSWALQKDDEIRLKTHLSPERLRFLSDNVDESESLGGKTGGEGLFGGFCGARYGNGERARALHVYTQRAEVKN